MKEEKKNEIILFENQGVKLEVNLKEETVWITANQMAILFDKKVLKEYMLKGYAINQKRLEYLEKTVKLNDRYVP